MQFAFECTASCEVISISTRIKTSRKLIKILVRHDYYYSLMCLFNEHVLFQNWHENCYKATQETRFMCAYWTSVHRFVSCVYASYAKPSGCLINLTKLIKLLLIILAMLHWFRIYMGNRKTRIIPIEYASTIGNALFS